VTGYLIGDDSTLHKRKGKKMQGLGRHHPTTEGKRGRGHSLVLALYVLVGRHCPLVPVMYRQKTVCQAEGVPFHSKVALMERCMGSFQPLAGTLLMAPGQSSPHGFSCMPPCRPTLPTISGAHAVSDRRIPGHCPFSCAWPC
jgi:hypothetical protein